MIRPSASPQKDAALERTGSGATAATRSAASLDADVAAACARIAPLWPLAHFVAVNPFLGHTGERFEGAAATLARVTGARMFMPRTHYAAEIAAGRITDADLAQAIEARRTGQAGLVADPRAPLPTVAELKAACAHAPSPLRPAVHTFADACDAARGTGWSALVIGEVAKWCAAYYDRGQSVWRLPAQGRGLLSAWRELGALDRNVEASGVPGFRTYVATLPEDAPACIARVLDQLAVPAAAVPDYLHRALASVGGWAAYVRYLVWDDGLYGRSNDALVQFLAVRLAYDGALHAAFAHETKEAWHASLAAMAHPRAATEAALAANAIDALLHAAYEAAQQRRLLAQLSAAATQAADARPAAQAAFCIDVRSEVFRRALETVAPDTQTLGFAGFFGFPIEYIPLGRDTGGAQCPVLLTPKFRVRETVLGADEAEQVRLMQLRRVRRRAGAAWKSFKASAVSCFSFVEAAGLAFAGKLAGATLGWTRTVPHPGVEGLDRATVARLGPRIAPDAHACGHPHHAQGTTGFTADERVAMAEAVLRAMSLTANFARVVLLAGHGSTTVNNPHATGLDCGACGGHTGEANARVAAAILNDAGVREALVTRGISIPADTWFVAGLHDTTLDEVALFDLDGAPAALADDVARLRDRLTRAGTLARSQRAALLGLAGQAQPDVDADIARRSRDWSEVRPEWGLAGNAAFVAAPRARTRGVDLGGRAFLHDYDWRADPGNATLELIMTAPMVVASWINLQYYGSTVDNTAFGSGNKVLHNVVGATVGVLEGNGGDLRAGLPLQSVHDGTRFVHEPLRLNVFIEAPRDAVAAIIAKHPGVRELLDNGWVHLFASDAPDRGWERYVGAGAWQPAGTA